MSTKTARELNGLRKAAVLAVMLGPEKTAEAIAKGELPEYEVERLAAEVARLQGVDEATRRMVAQEVGREAAADRGVKGLEAAHELLRRALGAKKADQVIAQVKQKGSDRPFAGLAQWEASTLLELLRDEPVQIIAVVLGYLPREKAGQVLSGLPEAQRPEVVMRIAKGREPFAEALRQMEAALLRKATVIGSGNRSARAVTLSAAGPRAVVETLNHAELSVETAVLKALAEKDPELGEQVRESMFIFEDLTRLDSRTIQMVLRQIEPSDLALALKGAAEGIVKVVLENLSENAAAGLREDLEGLGPVRRRDVYEAQQKVVMRVRELVDEGKINIRQEGKEEEDLIA